MKAYSKRARYTLLDYMLFENHVKTFSRKHEKLCPIKCRLHLYVYVQGISVSVSLELLKTFTSSLQVSVDNNRLSKELCGLQHSLPCEFFCLNPI